jgi:ribosome-associated heat shock protein Hsp15
MAADPPAPAVPASVRADVWLWSVRLFKTRSLAAAACRGGRGRRAGQPLKPASPLRPGDRLELSTESHPRELRVDALIERRVGAPLAVACYTELTDPAVAEAARAARRAAQAARPDGSGRPTKLERREIEKLRDGLRALGYPDSRDDQDLCQTNSDGSIA